MELKDIPATLRGSFQALKASKWKVAVYLPMMALFTTFFTLSPLLFCFIPLLITLILFGVPYYFGERRIPVMALVGLVVLLLTAVLTAGLLTVPAYGPPVVLQSSGEPVPVLLGGKLDPRVGDPDTLFEYTVWAQTSAPSANVTVFVNITSFVNFEITETPYPMAAADPADLDLRDGKLYRLDLTLPAGRHAHQFTANVSGVWSVTGEIDPAGGPPFSIYGPINQPVGEFFTSVLVTALFQLVLLGSLFYLILVMYWWVKRGTVIREQRRKALKDQAGYFECSNCGADVPPEADVCPRCGALFEEEE